MAKKALLPQFLHGEKIEIVAGDAFDYVEHMQPRRDFDYLFANLRHDAYDGPGMYLRLKRLEPLEPLEPQTEFLYWVEPTLLSSLPVAAVRRYSIHVAYCRAARRLSDASLQ